MYTEFYGLKGEPFLLTPDHRFYFESQVHGQAMAHLMYGLNRRRRFYRHHRRSGRGQDHYRPASVRDRGQRPYRYSPYCHHASDRTRTFAHGLRGLWYYRYSPGKGCGTALAFNRFSNSSAVGISKALLVVDEAQNLSADTLEELRMLSNFQLGNASPCQIFLVGQPQFRNTLAHPDLEQLRQRVIASYHLGALSSEECGLYVIHRMKQVGWTNDPRVPGGCDEGYLPAHWRNPAPHQYLMQPASVAGIPRQSACDSPAKMSTASLRICARKSAKGPPKQTAHYLAKTADQSDIALSVRIDTVERELETLRRIAMSLGKIVLRSDRRDGD